MEEAGFKRYVEIPDPSFTMPTRQQIRDTGLPDLKETVEQQIRSTFDDIDWLNISLVGWTDGIYLCFNRYTAQGKILSFLFFL